MPGSRGLPADSCAAPEGGALLRLVVTGGNTLNDLDFRIGDLLLRHLAPDADGPTS